jgi:Mn-dependent DtxR family transcriptional regulator
MDSAIQKPAFTDKQGQYLAFIHAYTLVMGRSPAEADIQRFFAVTPPSVHQMVLTLERLGFISRKPGAPRSIELLLDPEILPRLQPVISSVQKY